MTIEPIAALWALFASAFVSATLAPGGSEAVLAYLVHASEIPGSTLLAVATLGNTLGAVTTWLLGYWTASRYPADRPEQPGRQRSVAALRRYGLPLLFLSWLPVVGDGFCFAAGWLRLRFWPSTLAIASGKALRYAAIVYAMA